jgi:hypothetical protein
MPFWHLQLRFMVSMSMFVTKAKALSRLLCDVFQFWVWRRWIPHVPLQCTVWILLGSQEGQVSVALLYEFRMLVSSLFLALSMLVGFAALWSP